MNDDRKKWILKEYSDTDITKIALCKKHGISRPTLDRWIAEEDTDKIGYVKSGFSEIGYSADDDRIVIVQGKTMITIPRVKFMSKLYMLFTLGVKSEFVDYNGQERRFKVMLE